ncbi:cytochrome o ubiquinol oxidase subunit IV [Bradyrhizobium sp. ARR65]|uniref:cytochrome o ubiquinol oxidase subunit IV n=1 Tax=Bradyrhizobium sp. ARR65 TaxID=1040989 RepID=UPI0004652167|nr:cytochrome o ubiquinol oxidase subunit IV [Bradyrhizobium sp. ARR65]
MTAHSHSAHHAADHATAHGDITLSGYLTGFGLSVILTAIPFWLVMTNALGDKSLTAVVILGFAAVQIVVHMIYFLHMNTRSEGGWSMLALIFTLILLVITMTGSLWIMRHLNTNMMPTHEMSRMQ